MPQKHHTPIPPLSPKDIARFWSSVSVKGDNDCWLWGKSQFIRSATSRGNRDRPNYGQFWAFGRNWHAHRIAYFLFNQEDLGESMGCHTCDNPPCFNPDHLFPGTQSDNIKDSVRKGRWPGLGARTTCRKGHPKPYLGSCKICTGAYHAKYYQDHREKLLARAAKRDRRKVKC